MGTLIRPHPSVSVAYGLAAERQGVRISPEVLKSRFAEHFGKGEFDDRRGPLATDDATEVRRWRRIVHGVLPEVPDVECAFEELWDHFGRPESWEVFEDVEPALKCLSEAGISLSIVSNFDKRLNGVLDGLPAIADRIDLVTISSEVGYRKPHPEIYRIACERLGLAPVEVMGVGDDYENDVLGARACGLHAVLLDRRETYPTREPRSASLNLIAKSILGGGRVDG